MKKKTKKLDLNKQRVSVLNDKLAKNIKGGSTVVCLTAVMTLVDLCGGGDPIEPNNSNNDQTCQCDVA